MKMIALKTGLASLVLFALCGLVSAASSFTKEDVIQMATAGRSDQSILDALQASHSTFNLTADDIADLRTAGVSQAVIDEMINAVPSSEETSPDVQRKPTQNFVADSKDVEPAQDQTTQAAPAEPEADNSGYATSVEYVPEPMYYPEPWPVVYPFYPIYAPVYYPVYQPFFTFFGGFSFSFAFGNPFGFHAIFPCDRNFVVVNNRFGSNRFGYSRFAGNRFGRDTFARSRPFQFSTPRTYSQVGSSFVRGRPTTGGGSGRMVTVHAPVPGPSVRPGTMGQGRPGGNASMGRSTPRFGPSRPGISPRAPSMPRVQPPQRFQTAPRFQPAPRFQAAPRFQQGPRFNGPSFRAPRTMSAPHQGYSGGGGARGGSGGYRGGGGGGHRGHR
jgi:hypothetical protein